MSSRYPPNPAPEPAGPRSGATLLQAWLDEIEDASYRWCNDYYEAAACAELPDELSVFSDRALYDPNFENLIAEWDIYICENELPVLLEQCCDEGVLLPREQRFFRLRHCPEEHRKALRGFIVNCPKHVQYRLALYYYLVVRMGRAEATGNPEWRPETAPPRSVYRDNAFYRPSRLVVRNYAR